MSVLCLIITLNIITEPATSAIRNSRPLHKRTSYSHGQGHSHNHIKYDNAYFYDYRIHGADNKHHGEDQYFGQSEYRNDNKVSKFFYNTLIHIKQNILIILIYAYFLITISFFQVSGKYYVQLPDGRVQIVTYTVDGASGYVAHVSYIRPSANPQAPVLSYTDSPAIELL